MKWRALFGFSLVLALGTLCAEHDTTLAGNDSPSRAVASASQAAAQQPEQAAPKPPLTPREKAEMRADILMARKEFAEAAKAYEEILRQNPRDAVLLNKIGICYQQLNDLGRARHYYKQANKVDKKYASAINNLGTLEYSDKRYKQAIKYFKKALALPGNQASIYSNLGYSYCGVKDYQRAMEAFGKAVALDPQIFDRKGGIGPMVEQRSADDPGALYFVIARSFAKAGDAEQAARYLKRARDSGYKQLRSAEKDPDFARVIHDRRVQEVLRIQPPYAPPTEDTAPPPH